MLNKKAEGETYLIGEFGIEKEAWIALPVSLPFLSRTNPHAENKDTKSLSAYRMGVVGQCYF